MLRFSQSLCLLQVMLMLGPAAHAVTVPSLAENTVDVYDEQAISGFTVNFEAPGSIDLATFKTDVAAAWANDTGGVINFDTTDISDPLPQRIEEIVATYGTSGSKTIQIINGDTATWDNNPNSQSGHISGDRQLRKDCTGGTACTNDFIFDIGTISDGSVVESIGVTAISRDGNTFDYDVSATFNDGSTSATMSDRLEEAPGDTGTDNTFFGVTAPAGLWITQFTLANGPLNDLNGGFGSMDDLAFITRAGSVSLDGNFDGDSDVDGADFLAWQRGEATGGATPANLTLWQDNYGTGAVSAVSSVPEPASVMLLGIAGVMGVMWRRS